MPTMKRRPCRRVSVCGALRETDQHALAHPPIAALRRDFTRGVSTSSFQIEVRHVKTAAAPASGIPIASKAKLPTTTPVRSPAIIIIAIRKTSR